MALRRITEKQKANGMRWCQRHGKGVRIPAVYRVYGGELLCEDCALKYKTESTDYSEADYATWLRL